MNKFLHILVYLFLALAGVGLFFEIQLNAKRSELTERNRMQEDYLVKIAMTIEKVEPDKNTAFESNKDSDPVEAKYIDVPNTDNLLADYEAPLEQRNLETYNWDPLSVRQQLRTVYLLDAEGKPLMDGNEPMKRGPGTEDELLSKLFESAKTQQERLNTTRAALTEMRGKLDQVVSELNKLKPEARQDKVTIEEQKEKIAKLEEEKSALEDQVTRLKSQIDELNAEITSLKDEVQTAKDETEVAKEEIEKQKKLVEQLKILLAEAIQNAGSKAAAGVAVESLAAGDKGKIVKVNNDDMFAIVEFSPETMKELKGEEGRNPLPSIELSIRRPGYNGAAGEFVGRIKLRQEVRGKNYVVCDILGAWEQDKAKIGDVIFAD